MAAYYNEIEPYAAQWLRNLIAAGHIAPGDVDERSIEDVRPDDLRGYTQCHFFAGIGVWSSALRLAGWPDDRPVWTGSCPCQPFSAAGKGLGFADERHLWPAWHHLISECRPPVVFGEQVASKDVDPWIDLVFDDLEAMEYACAANPFPSAGVGAPHIRDRTFFVAHAHDARSQGRQRVRERSAELAARARRVAGIVADAGGEGIRVHGHGSSSGAPRGVRAEVRQQRFRADARAGSTASDGLADTLRPGSLSGAHAGVHRGEEGTGPRHGELERCGSDGRLADTDISTGRQGRALDAGSNHRGDALERARPCCDGSAGELADAELQPGRAQHECQPGRRAEGPAHAAEPWRDGEERIAGPTNGFWRAADWILCRDEKWRPVEPGTQPLAHGLAAGVGKLSAEQQRLASLAGLDGASLKRAKAYRVGTLRGFGNAINREAAAAFIAAADEAMTA
ncbi:DNA cytosine methyltransferase [Paraburkholderia tropica]|uniref:DNA cytosine methyltransferase n=1 Tax=Paraburkholderia tropica TaxID=92647 RepID=UPI002AB62C00|nr:DNA cytosine methyltransferase [Paraburkholderia tropica]